MNVVFISNNYHQKNHLFYKLILILKILNYLYIINKIYENKLSIYLFLINFYLYFKKNNSNF